MEEEKSKSDRRKATAFKLLLAANFILGDMNYATAQTGGNESDGSGQIETTIQIDINNPEIEQKWIRAIRRNLDSVSGECRQYNISYRPSCLQQGFSQVAQRMPTGGEFGKIRLALFKGARDLGGIVSRNAEPGGKQITAGGAENPQLRTRRKYRPIKAASLNQALRAAVDVIDALETELLRSSENGQKRGQNYQSIARAVASSKTLLRS